MKINFNSIESLKQNGFEGFKTVAQLMNDASNIPCEKGVYMAIRPNTTPPEFLTIGTEGYFKDKNPNVSLPELHAEWVDKAIVVYIGKAGGTKKDGTISSATLQSRLKQYLKFGQGKKIGHWGGRLIWQLKDSKDLLICWEQLSDEEPREREEILINLFKEEYEGQRPFANLQD
jgi:hypothetical protein